MPDSVDIEKLVGELELGVDRLRSLYEQYFMGIEKLEPAVPRKDVDRRIHVLRKEQIRNTALRFRFQMILQRYNTYQTHWQRVCREIENGTYKRHLARAQQRFAPQAGGTGRSPSMQPPAAPVLTRDLAAELAELDKDFAPAEVADEADVELVEEAAAPAAPPVLRPPPPPPRPQGPPVARQPPPSAVPGRPAPAASRQPPPPPRAGTPVVAVPPPRAPTPGPPAPTGPSRTPAGAPPPPRSPGDLPDERVRQLYSQYVDAKRRQNESTAAITYDAVARSLRDSSARLREKHGKAVDFEVTVKDGKTILKPVLK